MAEEVHFWELKVVDFDPQLLVFSIDPRLSPSSIFRLHKLAIPHSIEPLLLCICGSLVSEGGLGRVELM